MTTKTISQNQRTAEIVEGEVLSLETLTKRRNSWLNDPINKQLSTYEAVRRDTIEMGIRLKELKDELNDIETNH
ncbi:MAG: hypothetical protein PHE03_06840 [Bacteroidales bacterium]|nr:hypothetical protein [Bacteroidales bacterium]